MSGRIAHDPRGLGPMQGRFDVEDRSIAAAVAIGRLVVDEAHGVVRDVLRLIDAGARGTVRQVLQPCEIDANPEVDVDLANSVAEIVEREVGILAGVDDHNEPTSPPYHLVEPKILEMPAVRQIDVPFVVGRQAEGFLEQGLNREIGSLGRVRIVPLPPRVPKPPAKPDIEECEQERDRRRRIVAHVWTDGRAGNRHRGSERYATGLFPCIFTAGAKAFERATAVPGADGEWLRLAFLPGESFGLDNIERDVEHMEEAERVLPVASGLWRPQFMGANIIAGVEAGEAIRVSRLTRRTEVAPGESVSVDRVQREAVYVHVLRRDDFDDQRDSYTHHEVEDNGWRGW